MVKIKENYANAQNYGSRRNMSNVKFIVIHFTANDGDSDESNGKYFHNNVVKASAHYFVDSDSATESVPVNYAAWSVGGNKYANTKGAKYYKQCTNSNSINIELCDDVKNGIVYPSERTIKNALELVRHLMIKYNIDQAHVIRHYDVTGKPCPSYWVDDARWKKEFWDLISVKTMEQSNPYPVPTRTIYYNSVLKKVVCTGEDVKWVQQALLIKGYSLDIDGRFGPASDKALKDFQLRNGNGLSVDGRCGPKTRKALMS